MSGDGTIVARVAALTGTDAWTKAGVMIRATTDPRAANFLRKLARVSASRILVTTRLYPADLQTVTGAPVAT